MPHRCDNPTDSEPRRYAHPDIRDALSNETASKCAYCEGYISDLGYPHIEHKLPKRKHPVDVCSWENLTLACARCNTNKGDYDDPELPLLDPYVDNVERDVVFGGPLAIPRGGPRARASITRLKLNRMELLFSRSQALERVGQLLDLIERAKDDSELQSSLWLEVDSLTDGEAEFASASRYFLESEIRARGLERPATTP